jgi:lipopolysaccharide/colanic/teichoic acid biosynthesis glycosyltransferase
MTAVTDLGLDNEPAIDRCAWLRNHTVRRSVGPTYHVTKRALDIVVASIALLVALPTLMVAALLIVLESPGPVLFVQARTGQHGRRFKLYKLRTMVPDASARKEELLHLNSRTWPDFKIEHDPRVLKVGRFLRATSIDELPQLFNVLRGDMSLVGPRPISLEADGFASWQRERFAVKPGLTGLWQLACRSDPSLDLRARMDIAWLLRRSFVLDLLILCKTLPAVFRGRGAY